MLTQSAIFLVAAVVAVAVFKRIGLGTVLGYLAAGALIGPSGLGLIHDVDQTLHVAELGVVFLLFLIGLELQPSRLWTMRGTVFGLGGAQVALTTAAITGIGLLLGAPLPAAVVAGVGVSMSSTAFATQILGEKNELGAPHGRSAFGILLFQDVAAIPVLALVPLLGPAPAATTGSPLTHGLVIVGVIAGLVIAGRFFLRPAFRFIAEARSHELSTATALLVVLGTALVMEHIGLSMALGAFIAGVLLADSEYRHELEADIEPFKGLLLGLFFMAVGMSANLRLLKDRPLVVLGLVLGLVAVKMTVLYVLGRITKLSRRGAASLGASISQGGEFAFVIFGVARGATVLKPETTELLVVVVTLSMALTPLLFVARDRILARLAAADRRSFDQIYDEGSSVIIAGFGRFGQIVGRVLRLKRIAFTALDASPTHVDFVRRYGNQIYYGDASRVDLLRAAGAERARLIVLAIDDMDASMRTLHVVQSHFPNLTIVARARNRQHAYALLDAGVTNIIRETFAGSLDAARITLEALGLPSDSAREAVRRFGEYDEAQVRRAFVLRHDEKALVESAKQYGAELERIFEEDAAHRN
ncbi:monovalent cation:proton antiporter-2 (CPA2) family protein [Polyangium sorediatum]|uniref:Monovalent cation:proton antiporter-2 (CPA2) family protein n=1 Tax=Polyangium sorediatum TaxID=889274 RepID=A0ABT6P7Z0_9BACT|nr:monovalent cation:proton antiporter-2 (CPA2) family protein [Polyangium sorediatum]MDI1436735.1 monovalent cation:proton antiporter-2 (CPA2) family protein [Polyangium sorediatum]